MKRLHLVAVLGAVLFTPALAQENPPRDPVFERWVHDTFFSGYRPAAGPQRWDVPASANPDHGDVPVSLRTARFGAALDLGEALPQYEIDEPFMLVVGFWEPVGERKRFVKIVAPVVSPEQWRKLWGPVTYADLQRLDALIKDTGPTLEELRRLVIRMRNSPPFNASIIQLNPKVDERQRHLLCSIRFQDLFAYLAPGQSTTASDHPVLFGTEYTDAPAVKPAPAKQN